MPKLEVVELTPEESQSLFDNFFETNHLNNEDETDLTIPPDPDVYEDEDELSSKTVKLKNLVTGLQEIKTRGSGS